MMDKTELNRQRWELEQEIETLGYQTLRYSLLCPEKEHREEWQWRIEYENGKYFIYGLADRASILGHKFEFDNFSMAKTELLIVWNTWLGVIDAELKMVNFLIIHHHFGIKNEKIDKNLVQ